MREKRGTRKRNQEGEEMILTELTIQILVTVAMLYGAYKFWKYVCSKYPNTFPLIKMFEEKKEVEK